MYVPAHFKVDDRAELIRFMHAHAFATVITAPDGIPFASHVPLLIHEEGGQLYLRSHLARANKQWQHFDGRDVLVVFQGPHALIHSNWYASTPNVPTWNYAVVHAYGPPRVVDDAHATREIAFGLVAKYTPDMHPIPEDYERRLLAGVVTFEIRVTRLEGKFKLGQNRSEADLANVHRALSSSEHDTERALADLMRSQQPDAT